jgi:cytochrome b561
MYHVSLRNTENSWGAPAKLFHWTMAVLIFVQLGLGWAAASWRLSPLKLNLFVWHKSLGILILMLVALRILWRLGNPAPGLPSDTPPWERRAARLSHGLLYALMVAMPVTGWIANSAANVPFSVFWLVPLPAIVGPSKAVEDLATLTHFTLFVLLALVLVAHIGAALRHHYVKRNNVLARMLPGKEANT